jgi:hypothetical protein
MEKEVDKLLLITEIRLFTNGDGNKIRRLLEDFRNCYYNIHMYEKQYDNLNTLSLYYRIKRKMTVYIFEITDIGRRLCGSKFDTEKLTHHPSITMTDICNYSNLVNEFDKMKSIMRRLKLFLHFYE